MKNSALKKSYMNKMRNLVYVNETEFSNTKNVIFFSFFFHFFIVFHLIEINNFHIIFSIARVDISCHYFFFLI